MNNKQIIKDILYIILNKDKIELKQCNKCSNLAIHELGNHGDYYKYYSCDPCMDKFYCNFEHEIDEYNTELFRRINNYLNDKNFDEDLEYIIKNVK